MSARFSVRAGLLLWVCGLVLPLPAAGQQDATHVGRAGGRDSTLRVALAERGVLRIVRRDPLGPIALAGGRRLTVSGVAVYEPGREEVRLLGIRLDVSPARRGGEPSTTYVDLHEIERLLRAMVNMKPLALAAGGTETHSEFVTLEGFTVGVAVQGGKAAPFVRTSPTGKNLGLPASGFDKLREQIMEARTALFDE